jgi:3-hydroxyisobutyrate dehydrogenase
MVSDPNDVKESKVRVAVIGAGTMGGAMAARLLGAHFEVNVWSRGPVPTLTNLGATSHQDVREAVARAEIVITMLPTAEVTTSVMFDAKGFETMRHDAIWIQMATIGPVATDSMAAHVRSQRPDITFIDAPVSGSKGPAEAGQLLILASGDEANRRILDPVFAAVGKRTLWLGDVGAGSRMKLILNTWLAFQIEGAAEAVSLAIRLGVDSSALLGALGDSPLTSPYALAKLERMLHANFQPDFSLDLALKDLDLVGADAGIAAAPIAADIAVRWRQLVANGASGLDVSAAAMGLTTSMGASKE